MRARKVRLYIRVRRSDGRYSFLEPVWNRNQTLRACYALVDGKPEAHPEGVYYLRYLKGKKRVWQAVGAESDAALAAFQNKEHDLQSVALGRSTPEPDQSDSVSVADAVEVYLTEIRRFRSRKTIAACQCILGVFKERLHGRLLTSITRKDLLDHRAALEADGKKPRTVYNHIIRINTFLRSQGIVGLLKREDKPDYDEPEVEAYDADQLQALFAAADPEERLLFEFFLKTGFRDQEVMFSTWKNVDFKGKLIKVLSKPELGFRPKDKEERSVPVPDELITALGARRKQSTSMYIFPGANENPNGHFLRVLKQVAFRAGLNCSECVNKESMSCRTKAICKEWRLHKFRKTYATMHHEAGVPVATIQRWLGHSDLATTLRYLEIADLRSDRTRKQSRSILTFRIRTRIRCELANLFVRKLEIEVEKFAPSLPAFLRVGTFSGDCKY